MLTKISIIKKKELIIVKGTEAKNDNLHSKVVLKGITKMNIILKTIIMISQISLELELGSITS